MKNKIISVLSITALIVFAAVMSLGYVLYNCTHKRLYLGQ